jgi:hypothetical protein
MQSPSHGSAPCRHRYLLIRRAMFSRIPPLDYCLLGVYGRSIRRRWDTSLRQQRSDSNQLLHRPCECDDAMTQCFSDCLAIVVHHKMRSSRPRLKAQKTQLICPGSRQPDVAPVNVFTSLHYGPRPRRHLRQVADVHARQLRGGKNFRTSADPPRLMQQYAECKCSLVYNYDDSTDKVFFKVVSTITLYQTLVSEQKNSVLL